ncbi:MAG: class I SAM-dependent methyltransferase [Alphaproteobacteria bacterium]
MADVCNHYQELLAGVYSWMMGGFENALTRNEEFFRQNNIVPKGSKKALDLGCGCGFQSIPLADAGFEVTAIDFNENLLDELNQFKGLRKIRTIKDDLLNFEKYIDGKFELIVCMTDTILHLKSKEKLFEVFHKAYDSLDTKGKMLLTFRDLTFELRDLDRFIPIKSDDNTKLLCFLEYEEETVKVHDLLYKKLDNNWVFKKSFYHKLRLSAECIKTELEKIGFSVFTETKNGLVTIVADKK